MRNRSSFLPLSQAGAINRAFACASAFSRKLTTVFIMGLCLCADLVTAQSIRKNFREMGPVEITDYNDALQQFWSGGASTSHSAPPGGTPHIADYPIVHWENGTFYSGDATAIHMSPYFLPFHRTFLLDWELHLKTYSNVGTGKSYSYLSAPYWDWTDDAGSSTSSITSSTDPSFWAYSFIPASNFSSWTFSYVSGLVFPGSTQTVSFSRPTTFSSPSFLNSIAGSSVVNSVKSSSYYYDYTGVASSMGLSDGLEMGPHNNVHVFIGGTMSGFYSPLDPVFWLHHGMVDKVWNDWEEGFTSTYGSSDLLALPFTRTWQGTPGVFFPANLPVYTSEACSTKVDSRYLQFNGSTYDVWYAQNGTVLLNGNKNTAFHVLNGASKTYRYTVYNNSAGTYSLGDMYVGDIKRSGSTVITDTKGGFVADNGATCHFRAAKSIVFMPGFIADAGSTVTASIINTPNGF